MEQTIEASRQLAIRITSDSNKQTYYTIRLLVDRNQIANAYRAYGYFRWVDDWLDRSQSSKDECLAFIARQQSILECGYKGDWPSDMDSHETMLADLIRSDHERDSGLQSYIRNMMAVMAFDANRRGRLVSETELAQYTHHLAVGVTEALLFFIGHDRFAPQGEARFQAVRGAHVTHMLRDTLEDSDAGYYNIALEFVMATGLDPCDVASLPYREWVRSRVQFARQCFSSGREYLAQVESVRCRIAAFAYMLRFERVLDAIERANFLLQPLSQNGHKGRLWEAHRA